MSKTFYGKGTTTSSSSLENQLIITSEKTKKAMADCITENTLRIDTTKPTMTDFFLQRKEKGKVKTVDNGPMPEMSTKLDDSSAGTIKAVERIANSEMISLFIDAYMNADAASDLYYRLGEVNSVVNTNQPIPGRTDSYGNINTTCDVAVDFEEEFITSSGTTKLKNTYANMAFPPYRAVNSYDTAPSWYSDYEAYKIATSEEPRNFSANLLMRKAEGATYRNTGFKALNDNILLMQKVFGDVSGIVSTYFTEWDISLYMQEGLNASQGVTANGTKYTKFLPYTLIYRIEEDNYLGPESALEPGAAYTTGVLNAALTTVGTVPETMWEIKKYPWSAYWTPMKEYIAFKRCFNLHYNRYLKAIDLEDVLPKYQNILKIRGGSYELNSGTFSSAIRTRVARKDFLGAILEEDRQMAILSGYESLKNIPYWRTVYNEEGDSLGELDQVISDESLTTKSEMARAVASYYLHTADIFEEDDEDGDEDSDSDDNLLNAAVNDDSGGGGGGGKLTMSKLTKKCKSKRKSGKSDALTRADTARNDGSLTSANPFSAGATNGIDDNDEKGHTESKYSAAAGISNWNPAFFGGPHGADYSPESIQGYFDKDSRILRNVPRLDWSQDVSKATLTPSIEDLRWSGNNKYYSDLRDRDNGEGGNIDPLCRNPGRCLKILQKGMGEISKIWKAQVLYRNDKYWYSGRTDNRRPGASNWTEAVQNALGVRDYQDTSFPSYSIYDLKGNRYWRQAYSRGVNGMYLYMQNHLTSREGILGGLLDGLGEVSDSNMNMYARQQYNKYLNYKRKIFGINWLPLWYFLPHLEWDYWTIRIWRIRIKIWYIKRIYFTNHWFRSNTTLTYRPYVHTKDPVRVWYPVDAYNMHSEPEVNWKIINSPITGYRYLNNSDLSWWLPTVARNYFWWTGKPYKYTNACYVAKINSGSSYKLCIDGAWDPNHSFVKDGYRYGMTVKEKEFADKFIMPFGGFDNWVRAYFFETRSFGKEDYKSIFDARVCLHKRSVIWYEPVYATRYEHYHYTSYSYNYGYYYSYNYNYCGTRAVTYIHHYQPIVRYTYDILVDMSSNTFRHLATANRFYPVYSGKPNDWIKKSNIHLAPNWYQYVIDPYEQGSDNSLKLRSIALDAHSVPAVRMIKRDASVITANMGWCGKGIFGFIPGSTVNENLVDHSQHGFCNSIFTDKPLYQCIQRVPYVVSTDCYPENYSNGMYTRQVVTRYGWRYMTEAQQRFFANVILGITFRVRMNDKGDTVLTNVSLATPFKVLSQVALLSKSRMQACLNILESIDWKSVVYLMDFVDREIYNCETPKSDLDEAMVYDYWIDQGKKKFFKNEASATQYAKQALNEIRTRISVLDDIVNNLKSFQSNTDLNVKMGDIVSAAGALPELKKKYGTSTIPEEFLYTYLRILYQYRRYFINKRCDKNEGTLFMARALERLGRIAYKISNVVDLPDTVLDADGTKDYEIVMQVIQNSNTAKVEAITDPSKVLDQDYSKYVFIKVEYYGPAKKTFATPAYQYAEGEVDEGVEVTSSLDGDGVTHYYHPETNREVVYIPLRDKWAYLPLEGTYKVTSDEVEENNAKCDKYYEYAAKTLVTEDGTEVSGLDALTVEEKKIDEAMYGVNLPKFHIKWDAQKVVSNETEWSVLSAEQTRGDPSAIWFDCQNGADVSNILSGGLVLGNTLDSVCDALARMDLWGIEVPDGIKPYTKYLVTKPRLTKCNDHEIDPESAKVRPDTGFFTNSLYPVVSTYSASQILQGCNADSSLLENL